MSNAYASPVYRKGLEVFKKMMGPQGEQALHNLTDIYEDFAEFIIRVSFGEINSRDHLSPQLRQLCTVSSLLTHGGPALAMHITAAKNLDIPKKKVLDLVATLIIANQNKKAELIDLINGIYQGQDTCFTEECLTEKEKVLAKLCYTVSIQNFSSLPEDVQKCLESEVLSKEIKESIMHVSIYVGFPSAIRAMTIAGSLMNK